MKHVTTYVLAMSASFLLLMTGCSNSDHFPLAKVKGKVTSKGQPVKSGNISLSLIKEGNSPLVGKSATASIAEDGTFSMSTYEENDGAIIGKHNVSIGETDPAQPLPGKLDPPMTFEVKPGVENILNIELK